MDQRVLAMAENGGYISQMSYKCVDVNAEKIPGTAWGQWKWSLFY